VRQSFKPFQLFPPRSAVDPSIVLRLVLTRPPRYSPPCPQRCMRIDFRRIVPVTVEGPGPPRGRARNLLALIQQVGLTHLVDARFSGVAAGVGSARILGRIHVVPVKVCVPTSTMKSRVVNFRHSGTFKICHLLKDLKDLIECSRCGN